MATILKIELQQGDTPCEICPFGGDKDECLKPSSFSSLSCKKYNFTTLNLLSVEEQ